MRPVSERAQQRVVEQLNSTAADFIQARETYRDIALIKRIATDKLQAVRAVAERLAPFEFAALVDALHEEALEVNRQRDDGITAVLPFPGAACECNHHRHNHPHGVCVGAGAAPVWHAHEVRLVGLVAALLRIVHVSESHEQALAIADQAIRDDDDERMRQRESATEGASPDAISKPSGTTEGP